MEITISIMCYNYGQYLGRAIESGLDQQGHDFDVDVLVIDDGSIDNTPEVCQRYSEDIRVLRSENKGFPASLTRSIREARGEYVCLLDADDYFADTKLKELEPFIHEGYDFITHKAYLIDEEETLLRNEPKGGGSTSTQCIRREKALDLLPAYNDIYFHALEHLGRSRELDAPLTYYRVHEESNIRSRELGAWYDRLAWATHKLADHLDTVANEPPDWSDETDLVGASRIYRTIARYDEMEAELLRGNHLNALKKCGGMLQHAVTTPGGIDLWHLKLAARCLQGRAIDPPSQSKYRQEDS